MNLDVMMAVAGTLLMLCVYANRISMRYGIPSLLLFLSLGMLAGSDGAGIQFYNARIANYIGTFALLSFFSPAVLIPNGTKFAPLWPAVLFSPPSAFFLPLCFYISALTTF